MSVIHEVLRRARRRMIFASLLRNAVWSSLVASFLALLFAGARLLSGQSPLNLFTLILAAAVAAFFAVFLTLRQRPDLRTAALRLDTLGQTRDRFTAGLALDHAAATGPLDQLALDDCRAFAGRFDVRPLLPVRLPRSTFALAAPAIAAVFLFLQFRAGQRIDPAALAAQQELVEKATELEELQKKLADAAAEDPRLRELAEAVQKAIERLQKAAQNKNADAREAMKELASIEAMIAAMQKALAAQSAAMQKAAEQAEAGSSDAATTAAQATAQSPMSEEQRQQMEQAISDARAASQMDEAARDQALKKLAEQLRRAAQGANRPQSGRPLQRQLQAAMNALQNIKYGKSGGRPRPGPEGGQSKQRTMMQAFGPGENQGENGKIATGEPSGQPGSEHDEGTTESPYGDQTKANPLLGEGTQLDSVLSEGESLSALVPAAGDTSKSTRRYRDLYNAVAAEAQNTVDREDIPLASRFFIKRYFENIRPAE